MPKYMMAYHGGTQPKSKEEGMAKMEKWKAWVQSQGASIVNPGTPLPTSKRISAKGIEEDTDPNAMKGYAVIQADSMDGALAIAKTDPFLATGGTIRVSEMMEMP